MPNDLEYVVTGALLQCNQGTIPTPFQGTSNCHITISGSMVTTEMDMAPMANIKPFGICQMLSKTNPVPCMPVPTVWQDTYPVKVKGGKTLLFRSCMNCVVGGKMEFMTSGQVPLSPEDQAQLDALTAEAEEEVEQAKKDADAVGESGFFEGMIPIWGSGRDLINAVQTGDVLGGALAVGFLVWDVASIAAGVVSFGAGTALMQGAKGVLRGGVKSALKQGSKAVGKQLAKKILSAKNLAKAIGKNADSFAKAAKICVTTACFPAGTPVAVKDGYRNIEEIQAGDKVWSFNPDTGETALKEVVSTIQNEVDMLIQLNIGNEIIRSSRHHPFYSEGGWKDAGMLEPGDVLQTKDGEEITVTGIDYEIDFDLPEDTIQDVEAMNAMSEEELDAKRKTFKVFNFEVNDWHTYFVGSLMALVHNVCLLALAKAGVKYAKNILNGQMFDKAMSKVYTYSQMHLANGKVLDALIPGKEIISHKFTQLSDITLDTAKKYIDEIEKKYADQMTNSSKLTEQVSTQDLAKVLEIPPQAKEIPADVLKHASDNDVVIREISGDALEIFNKTKFW